MVQCFHYTETGCERGDKIISRQSPGNLAARLEADGHVLGTAKIGSRRRKAEYLYGGNPGRRFEAT